MQQHLLIDADDTLWENNIYFEQAIETFINFLNHSSLTPAEVRGVLDEVEMTQSQGYGTANFIRCLQETYRRLAEREVREEDMEQIRRFGEQIRQHPLQLLDGVQETLAYLAPRHRLLLLTKGSEEDQRLKIDSSGLDVYFEQAIVVAEKDVETYTRLVNELGLDPPTTWMIGNSPRSDINPALEAGLNAVYIPHANTWRLEMQELRPAGHGKFLTLRTFRELREHF